jgi:hypothetical protein
MSDSSKGKCNCSSSVSSGVQQRAATVSATQMVKGQIPQGFEATLNMRLVPGSSLNNPGVLLGCQPRGNSSGGWHAVSPQLTAIFAQADQTMVAWLAKDPSNAQSFLANPVAAMKAAGVQLSREQEKALSQATATAEAARFVAPGVKVTSLSAAMYPNDKVGTVGTGTAGTTGTIDTFGCGPSRKG